MSNPWTPPANLGDRQQQGYPSRRPLPQPNDNPGSFPKPPAPALPESLQMTAAPPPRPAVPGPGEADFRPGAIPGTRLHNVNSRQADPTSS
jgi:hypothetical protein